MAKHDLIFFEKRSTPKVVPHGQPFDAPESYGKQTKRRQATEEEERLIASGQWLRVDENGNKGGQPGYKKTQMPGREHLVHYGVKGMHWGIRKDQATAPTLGVPKGVKINTDGSIQVAKGATLQRLVRSNGESLPMRDITYASLNDYDNAKYIKTIGGKGIFGGGRDQILGITATAPIKAPSVSEATRIHSEMMLADAKFREKNTNMLGEPIGRKELERIRQNPTGKTAEMWYYQANVKLTYSPDFDPDAPYVQKRIREEMTRRGYNALRDENDFNSKLSKAPIIVFNPEKSLKVTTTTDITDAIRKANKEKLKQYKKQGESWVNSQLYTG